MIQSIPYVKANAHAEAIHDGAELYGEEVSIAVEQPVAARRIERQAGEVAEAHDAEEPTHSVDSPDVERVIPTQSVLERDCVEADDAGEDSDENGG